jgi:exodeoxyribonuclease VII large subunit
VGHEIDVTIADLVADRRALTPSEAAEIVLPRLDELTADLGRSRDRLAAALRGQLELARERLERLRASYGFREPLDRIRRHEQRLDDLVGSAALALRRRIQHCRERLDGAAGRLEALSPLRVLQRGYSITRDAETGTVLRRARDAEPGQDIETILHEGRLRSRIEDTLEPDGEGS